MVLNRAEPHNHANMKGLDGIQGPLCVGTGCFFNRKALYGYDPSEAEYYETECLDQEISKLLGAEPRNLENELHSVVFSLEKSFGRSRILLASVLVTDDRFMRSITPNEILRQAICVISCEKKTKQGGKILVGYMALRSALF